MVSMMHLKDADVCILDPILLENMRSRNMTQDTITCKKTRNFIMHIFKCVIRMQNTNASRKMALDFMN